MLETTAGRYYARELMSLKQDIDQDKEEISSSDGGYTSFDEMDGLSDSASTRPSHSRPTTPSDLPPIPTLIRTRSSEPKQPSHARTFSDSVGGVGGSDDLPYAVAQKAVLLLGLVPGTLTHARACLESARDEARRLADITPAVLNSVGVGGGGEKTEVKRMDRARKALSSAIPLHLSKSAGIPQGQGVPPVILVAAGGEEEEARRERRRRVADGVLHWQKEVKRLEEEKEREMMGCALVAPDVEVKSVETGVGGGRGGSVKRRVSKVARR